MSFSSIIDENSNELYKGLSDKDLTVKKNTLMVLTHLILNGMIKVKGQLGEMAKCLEDEEERISEVAKLFFSELSTKENAIYNNLPDGKWTLMSLKLHPNIVCSYFSPFCGCACCQRGNLPEYDEVHLHIHRESP